MMHEQYRSAINNCIRPAPQMEERIRNAVLHPAKGRRIVRRRIARPMVAVLAAILLLTLSFSTAMAFSPVFREAIISLFRIQTPEVLPDTPAVPLPEAPIQNIGEQTVEDAVSVQYFKVNGWGYGGNGVIIQHPQEGGSTAFFAVDGTALKQLASRYVDTTIDFEGEAVPLQFWYTVFNGTLSLDAVQPEERGNITAYVSPIAGRTDAVLLTLGRDSMREYTEYRMLFDLNTQKVTDLFAGMDLAQVGPIREIHLTDDLKTAVLRAGDFEKSDYFICNLRDGTLRGAQALMGQAVEACWILNNTTLFCNTPNEDGTFDCWSINVPTDEKTCVAQGATYYNRWSETPGIAFLGGRYALLIEPDGTTYVLDLLTGSKTRIEDFSSSRLSGELLSPGDERILFTLDGPDVMTVELGVLNIRSGKFAMMKREGVTIRPESSISWFDNTRIAIEAEDAEAGRYLYLYSFSA